MKTKAKEVKITKKFEYSIEEILVDWLDRDYLNRFGDEGWEMVGVESYEVETLCGDVEKFKRFYFKREVTNA
jgi:hypothetical protein